MKVENHQVKVISEPNSKGEVKAIFYVKDEQQQRPVSVTLLQPENEEEAIQCAVLARNAIVAIGEELVRVTDELSEVRRRMMAAAGYLSNLA